MIKSEKGTIRAQLVGSNGNEATSDSNGRLNIVQHAHIDSSNLHFHIANISVSQDYILIDTSDTTNYPHYYTDYIHLESCSMQIDSDVNGDYIIEIGFLENVDNTNGDFIPIYSLSGTKKTGNTQYVAFNGYPNAPRCKSAFFVSSDKSLDDTAFQTDVNLASTLDVSSANVPSGSGDIALRITRIAGSFNAIIDISYHSHG